MYKPLSIFLLILLAGCSHMTQPDKNTSMKADDQTSSEQLYWVNSWQRACQGVGEMLCLQVQKVNQNNPKNPDIESWQLFYAPIEDFDYELGYVYQIRLKETRLPAAQVPADASSIRYELLEVLDKQADETLRLHDIWALTELNGRDIEPMIAHNDRQQQPSLEFNLNKMQVFGTDSCNRLSGGIEALGQRRIKFGALATTLMACSDMKLADEFTQALNQVKYYQLSDLKLTLLNADEQSILEFKKVD